MDRSRAKESASAGLRRSRALIAIVPILLIGCTVGPGAPSSAPGATTASGVTVVTIGSGAPATMIPEDLTEYHREREATAPPLVTSPVPWRAIAPGATATPLPTLDLTLPACAGADVELTFGGWILAPDGPPVARVDARDVGSHACLLGGQPTITLQDRSGRDMITSEPADGPFGPAMLEPGLPPAPTVATGYTQAWAPPGYGSTAFTVPWCGPGPASLHLALPDGTPRDVPIDAPTSCAGGGAGFYVGRWSSALADTSATAPWSALWGWAALPDRATAGAPLEFTVYLTNSMDHPVVLDPCPSYTMRYSTLDGRNATLGEIDATYGLDCSTTSTIAVHGSAAFAMSLAVPAAMPPSDRGYLLWTLNGPDGELDAAVKVLMPLSPADARGP